MSTGRVNPFADPEAVPAFDVKPRAPKQVEPEQIDQLAKEHNFPSRQAPKASHAKPKASSPTRRRRVHRTGRNQQFNIKASQKTIERFYTLADEKGLTLGELLEHALNALETTAGPHQR